MTTAACQADHLWLNSRMATWKKVGENLVRHQGGTIYLRAKVAGKIIRRSLDTEDLAAAKRKRDTEIERIRKQMATAAEAAKTLGGALTRIEKTQVTDPHLKLSTRKFYEEVHKTLRTTLPLKRNLRDWKEADARAWWAATAKKYSPQRANHLLALVKRLGAYMAEHGSGDNPATKLRRIRVLQRVPFTPTKAQLDAIVESIRSQNKSASVSVAGMIGFLSFSGCRVNEARNVQWSDLNPEWSWLTITGGKLGTKNGSIRRIPVSTPLREILTTLHRPEATGPVFLVGRPREALNNACTRLKLPHLRIHDLRHFFASWCIENGVDIATVAIWLGHKDGGVLLMKTYGHIRDQHSLDSAAKLG
jgi:integrase